MQPPQAAPAPLPAASARAALPFETLARCRIDHGGLFLDLGSEAQQLHRSFSLGPFSDVESEAWADQSHARFNAAAVSYDFWLREPLQGLSLRVRASSGSATQLSASIDQTRVGLQRLRGAGFQTLVFPTLDSPLAPGRHQLHLRWSGRGASEAGYVARAEWIHWADPAQPAARYRAPHERSLRSDVTLAGSPRPALLLDAPGKVSCPVSIQPGSELRLGLGQWGEGEGVARIAARTDRGPRRILLERRISATAGWADVKVSLEPLAGQLVDLELEAVSDGTTGRVVFSEPSIVSTSAQVPASTARLAVLVIASGLHHELLPPFTTARPLRHAARLAAASVRFPAYRVPTTLAGGVVATLLSGLPPLAHQLLSASSRLPASVPLLSERVHEQSGESAFFSGVPQTRAAFGFERGWNRYEAFSPVHDVAATAPLERARGWLEQQLERDDDVRRLLVVHLRGGHPPWDLTREEVAQLEPQDYAGPLEARRGGIILKHQRAQPRPAQRRLSSTDWTRLQALELAALAKQDEALGSLLELLERGKLWEQTLFIFTGDVGPGDAPEAPFGDGQPLAEDRLVVPLWIKLPGAKQAGAVIPAPVSSIDVTATIAAALGLQAREGSEGLDLARLALGQGQPVARPLLSQLGSEYALRWGRWLLRGNSPHTPSLCDLSADPACAHDALERSPLAAEALWRVTFDEQRRQAALEGAAKRPELAPVDRETSAALQVWGE